MVVPRSRAAGRTLRCAGQRIALDLDGRAAVVVGGGQREARDARRSTAAPRRGSRACARASDRRSRGSSRWRGARWPAARPPPTSRSRRRALRSSFFPPFSSRTSMVVAPRVDGVLDQLLDHRGRPLDDLSRRDLIDEIGGEEVDAGHGVIVRTAVGSRQFGRESTSVSLSLLPTADCRLPTVARAHPLLPLATWLAECSLLPVSWSWSLWRSLLLWRVYVHHTQAEPYDRRRAGHRPPRDVKFAARLRLN